MQIKTFQTKHFRLMEGDYGVKQAGILKEMERTPLPDDVIYVPSVRNWRRF